MGRAKSLPSAVLSLLPAVCQLSFPDRLSDVCRHVVASDPQALPGSQAQRPGQPCLALLARTRVRRCALPLLAPAEVTNTRPSHIVSKEPVVT